MSSRAQQREAKLKERCDILADIVESVGPIYRSVTTTEDQKRFIETMIGAALWYLPDPNGCWTKKATVEAINSHHPHSGDQTPKLTADHEYPRKIAAADLLAKYLSADTNVREKLLPLYLSRYGGFNYITPRENRALMRYQRTEKVIDPLTVYGKAGVKLVSITRAELSKIKARDLYTIEQLLEKAY
jgi:hypothetical protein